jgi:hypothetical protein
MHYFPLIYRLVLAYADLELACFNQWHKDNRNLDSMTSPMDFEAWRHAQASFPTQMGDARLLLLGLAMDGISPFNMADHLSPYSIWPVIVNTYNLPPWLATKHGYCWLVMILPDILAFTF